MKKGPDGPFALHVVLKAYAALAFNFLRSLMAQHGRVFSLFHWHRGQLCVFKQYIASLISDLVTPICFMASMTHLALLTYFQFVFRLVLMNQYAFRRSASACSSVYARVLMAG